MEHLRKVSIQDFLSGRHKLFEEDYKITYRCRYKVDGLWVRAKIDMDNGIVYDLNGQVIRRCSVC